MSNYHRWREELIYLIPHYLMDIICKTVKQSQWINAPSHLHIFWLDFDRANRSFRLGANKFSKSSISSFKWVTVAWVKMHIFSVCSYLLNCLRSLGTMVMTKEVTETVSKSFPLSNSAHELPFFPILMCALYGQPRYFKFNQKNQNTAHVSRLSFGFLWLWSVQFNLHF